MITNTSRGLFAEFAEVGFVPVVAWTEHTSPQAIVPVSSGVLRVASELPGFRRLTNADDAELVGWDVYPASELTETIPELPAEAVADPQIDWGQRADGLTHQLTRGVHFRREASKVQRAAIQWAKRNGYTATTSIPKSADRLHVRFVPRNGKV